MKCFSSQLRKKEFDLRTFNSFEWTEHWIEVEWQYAFIVTVRVECDETTFLGILKWIELVSIGFYTSKTDLIFIRYSQFLIGIKMHRAQEGWFNHQVATEAASSAIANLLRLRTITIYLSIPFEYFNLIKIQLHIMQLSQIHTLIID